MLISWKRKRTWMKTGEPFKHDLHLLVVKKHTTRHELPTLNMRYFVQSSWWWCSLLSRLCTIAKTLKQNNWDFFETASFFICVNNHSKKTSKSWCLFPHYGCTFHWSLLPQQKQFDTTTPTQEWSKNAQLSFLPEQRIHWSNKFRRKAGKEGEEDNLSPALSESAKAWKGIER